MSGMGWGCSANVIFVYSFLVHYRSPHERLISDNVVGIVHNYHNIKTNKKDNVWRGLFRRRGIVLSLKKEHSLFPSSGNIPANCVQIG